MEVAEKHDVSIDDMVSSRRPQKVYNARHEYFYRARCETSASLPQIGRACGGKDHTTVLYGIERHKQRMADGAE